MFGYDHRKRIHICSANSASSISVGFGEIFGTTAKYTNKYTIVVFMSICKHNKIVKNLKLLTFDQQGCLSTVHNTVSTVSTLYTSIALSSSVKFPADK